MVNATLVGCIYQRFHSELVFHSTSLYDQWEYISLVRCSDIDGLPTCRLRTSNVHILQDNTLVLIFTFPRTLGASLVLLKVLR